MRDSLGYTVSGATVTFTAPASGASGTFAGGALTATVMSDANGLVTAPSFTANTVAGSYSVSASVSRDGTTASVNFALTNTAGAATSVAVARGNNQSATVGTAFGTPLSVTVTDNNANPVSGASVTFTAPASGAGARFPGSVATVTVTTDGTGTATAPALTANGTAGAYSITASVSGVAMPASFALTNSAGSAANVVASAAATNQSTAITTAFTTPLSVDRDRLFR